MESRRENKVVLFGPEGVGKSCMMERIRTGAFHQQQSTIGAVFSIFRTKVGDTPVKLGVWDTAGQERFSSLMPMYTRGSRVTILCIHKPDIQVLERYLSQCRQNNPEGKVYINITKCDLLTDREGYLPIKNIAERENAELWFTSSLKGENVNEIFTDIAKYIVENTDYIPDYNSIDLISENPKGSCCW